MFGASSKAKISKQPSLYPSIVFHLIRTGQFVSSAIVLGILSFFIYFLRYGKFYVPWTFILLLVVSILTICALAVTGVLHYTRTLPPSVNLLQNAFNTTLWALGFALLIWNTRQTLANRCTYASWHSDDGIMICRMYKVLATFTITGFLSSAFSLFLDFRTHRLSTHRGTYNPMHDVKHTLPTNPQQDPYSTRSVSHEQSRPYKIQRPIEAQHFGYSAPSEQTTYDGPSGIHLT